MKTLSLILSVSAILSFAVGRMAGEHSSKKVEESLSEILSSISIVHEIESINAKPKLTHKKSLSTSDPNL